MIRSRFLIAVISGLVLSQSAADVDSETPTNLATPVYAIELYVKALPVMTESLVKEGKSKDQAEYLVFWITFSTAKCALEELGASTSKPAQSFLSYLAEANYYAQVEWWMDSEFTSSQLSTFYEFLETTRSSCESSARTELHQE